MFKIATTSLLAALLFTGCNNIFSGDSNQEIADKDKVIIIQDISQAGCITLDNYPDKEDAIQEYSNGEVTSLSFSSKEKPVNCATFGKTEGTLLFYQNAECLDVTFEQAQDAFPDYPLEDFRDNNRVCVASFNVN